MLKTKVLEIQRISIPQAFYLLFFTLIFCQKLWASQEAMVLADRAVIYSDREMTSPIGYVPRGKKLVVGEIARNKGQVYPIVVSGKVGYIRVLDVTTERESMESTRLTAERFMKRTREVPQTKFVVSYFQFSPTVKIQDEAVNDTLRNDEDPFNMHGASMKAEVLVKDRFDIQLIGNFLAGSKADTRFNIVEAGVGGAFRLLDFKKFLLRAEAQALAVPFSSYEVGNDFRVKSYGYTVGAGVVGTLLFGKHWGLEAFYGLYQTKILGFKAPDPYEDISPTFSGSRMGLGLNFTF